MRFTVWKTHNGWIVIKGDHDYLHTSDMVNVRVFTNAGNMASWMSAQK